MQNQDEIYMRRALELARHGKFKTSPNPRVGCVIVYQNKIIGEGFHRQYGDAHAEVYAVNSVINKELLKEATVYLTLEPCAHFGKTPPCVDLLIHHRFPRVVIATADPFKKVNGEGIAKLKAEGVKVTLGVCECEAIELNKRFFTFHKHKRPYIILKWAVSADGYIGVNDNTLSKEERWITNERSNQLSHLWRAEEDAILVGTNTAILDNPQLDCRNVNGQNPIRILIDKQLKVEENAAIFNKNATTYILNHVKNEKKGHLEWKKYKEGELFDALFNLCIEKQILSIIVEGGAITHNSFISKNTWDETRVLEGNVRLGKGVSAPNLNRISEERFKLGDNWIDIYRNDQT